MAFKPSKNMFSGGFTGHQTLVFEIHRKKSAKQENWSLFINSIL
jgi:hypothetical protein